MLSLPAGWANQDVVGPNSAAMPGSADFVDGGFVLRGSGNDIWNQSDEFQYAYTQLDGDGEIVGRVESFLGVIPENTSQNEWAKAGVMFRASLDANSTHASAFVTGTHGLQFTRRAVTGGNSSDTTPGNTLRDGTLLKLVRQGNTFTAWYFDDSYGEWSQVLDGNMNPVAITLNVPNKMYAGVGITSHDNNRTDEARFTEVAVSANPDTDEPGTPLSLWATGTADGKIVLNWLDDASNESGFVIERSTNPNFTGTVTKVNLPADTYTYTDSDVVAGTNYYYRVKAVNSVGGSDYSNMSMMTAGMVSGLTARFWNANNNWDGPVVLTRTDANINYDWGSNSPGAGVNADNFSSMWTGRIRVQETGTYTFISMTDDDGYFWVNGELVSSDPGGHGIRDAVNVVSIDLEEGQWYDVMFKHAEGGGGAGALLDWIRPDGVRERVPAGAFVTTMSAPTAPSDLTIDTSLPYQFELSWTDNSVSEMNFQVERSTDANFATFEVVAKVGTGATSATDWILEANKKYYYRVRAWNFDGSSFSNVVTANTDANAAGPGLLGQYFNSTSPNGNLDGTRALIRWDAQVDFDWPDGVSPGEGVNQNDFMSLWQGTLIVPTEGDYTFGTASDDGIRLWVNGELATNAWVWRGSSNSPIERSKPIHLKAGEYPIVIKSFEGGGGAGARVWWSGPGIPEQKIPAANLKGFIAPAAKATNLTADAGPTSMYVSWTNNAINELYSRLEMSKDGGTTWQVLKTMRIDDGGEGVTSVPSIISNPGGAGAQSSRVLVTGLQPNTGYKFRVVDANFRGEVVSDVMELKTADVPPGLISVTPSAPAASTNLTTEANLDWAHWGYDQNADGFNVRFGGSGVISDYEVIGTATVVAYNANGTTFTWTDGRPGANNPEDVVLPNDPVEGFLTDVPEGQTTNWPAGENPTRVFDNNPGTKFLNFNKLNSGVIVTPSVGATVISGLGLVSANDAPERDPASYVVEGSNDGGNTWTKISEGKVAAFTARGQKQILRFANTKSYAMYKVTFPTLANAGAANSMQIAEIELYKNEMNTATSTDDAVAVAGQGNGFKFTVPATTATRKLKVYVAVDGDAQGQLVATLSDQSVPVYESAVLSADGSLKTQVYTIEYKSGLADKQLTVEWKSVGGTGKVILQAASLSETVAPTATTDLKVDARFVSGQVLSWTDAATNEVGYRIERAAAGSDTWVTLDTIPANSTTFADASATQGAAYQYRVVAINAVGTSVSNVVSVTTAAFEEPWQHQNLGTSGDPAYAGDVGYNPATGEWNIKASGADVWDNNIRAHYAFQEVHGDVRMTARITGLQNTDGWAKAGIMLTEGLYNNSRYLFNLATPGNRVRMQGYDNGNIDTAQFGTNMSVPGAANWLRLERMGNAVTSYWSADGVTWSTIATRSIDWSEDLYLGLAYSSHNNSTPGVATFDNVVLEDLDETTPLAPTNVEATPISGNRAVVTWNDNANNETSYVLQRRVGSSAWEDVTTLVPNTSFYVDSYLDSNVSYSYRVMATGFAGDTSWATSASAKAGQGTQPVAEPWQSADVGTPYYYGSSGFLNGVYDVTGGGSDIWGNEGDNFHFVYQEMEGDFVISGQVKFQEQSSEWAKAGFMIRAATDDSYGNFALDTAEKGAPMVMLMSTPRHGQQFGWRTTLKGGPNAIDNGATNPKGSPAYIKLARVNGEITAWLSQDGSVWTQYGQPQNIGNGTVYVGMAVTATNDNATSLALFKNVSLATYDSTMTPEAPSDLATIGLGSKDVVLNWTDHALAETGFKIERSINGVDGWTVIGTVDKNVTRFVDRNAAGGSFFYRVCATNSTAVTKDSAYSEVVAGAPGVDGAPVHMNDFTNVDGWQLNGNASVVNGVLRLTNNQNDQRSSAFTKLPQSLQNGFKVSFDMLMSNASGADGMAFVLQAAGTTALGGGGGGLGYDGIRNSAAVKFDIYKNGGHDVDETGLYFNGANPQYYDTDVNETNADIDLRPTLTNLLDTKWRVTMTYEGGKLKMTMAKADAPDTILFTNEWTVDLASVIGADSAFVGFTAATGGANVRQEVFNFHFGPVNELPVEQDWTIDGTDAAEVLTLKRVGDNVQLLDSTGAVLATKPFAQIVNILVNGKGGNDTLVLDFSGGELVASGKNVSFDGGAGNDLLKLAANSGTNALVVDGAAVTFGGKAVNMANAESIGLALSGTAAVSLAAGQSKALKLGSLSLADNAKLELNDNDLIVTATPETRNAVLAAISNAIKSARGTDGKWAGAGLTSTAAKTNKQTGLAVMLNAKNNQPIVTNFGGQAVTANDILVKYTWNGDVNLDGQVDAADYFLVDSGYITQEGQYRNGDLNLDGVVDAADYFLVDSAYIAQTGVMGAEEAPAATDVVVLKAATAAKPQQAPSVLEQLFSSKPVL